MLQPSLGTIATVVSLLIITVMLLMRYFHTQRMKEQWKLEIQQAQQVQQILIPNQLPQVRGLTIESEYRPAREVGGDFFQVLPGEIPGSVLIMVGDVTGKGMQAGMLGRCHRRCRPRCGTAHLRPRTDPPRRECAAM